MDDDSKRSVFIYFFYNNCVFSTDYTVLNDKIINELWYKKVTEGSVSQSDWGQYPDICLERQIKPVSQNNQSPSKDLNKALTKHKAGLITIPSMTAKSLEIWQPAYLQTFIQDAGNIKLSLHTDISSVYVTFFFYYNLCFTDWWFLHVIKVNKDAKLTKWFVGFIFPADSNMPHTLDSRTSSRTLAASRISRTKSNNKQQVSQKMHRLEPDYDTSTNNKIKLISFFPRLYIAVMTCKTTAMGKVWRQKQNPASKML
jgi:hypothetical protein